MPKGFGFSTSCSIPEIPDCSNKPSFDPDVQPPDVLLRTCVVVNLVIQGPS